MTAMTPHLTVSNLVAGYRKRPVIRGLTLPPIRPGEVTALVGPNAAGKTTLLRALAGLIPASGSIRLGERELLPLGPAARAAITGFMPQSLPQRAALTVLEGVIAAFRASPPDIAAEPSQQLVHERAIAILDRLGIVGIALERLDQLSGGQRQLASLAQALVREPQVLLLDEPTSALDLRHQVQVMKVVRSVAADGKVVVAVLHDLALAARWADTVVVLHQGALHAIGTPHDAMTVEMLADVYGVRARIELSGDGSLLISADDVTIEANASNSV